MLTLLLIFLFFNVFKYLIPLRIKSPFFVLFYVLAALQTIGRIVEVLIFSLPAFDEMSLTGGERDN